jgi:hypothetical protein
MFGKITKLESENREYEGIFSKLGDFVSVVNSRTI